MSCSPKLGFLLMFLSGTFNVLDATTNDINPFYTEMYHGLRLQYNIMVSSCMQQLQHTSRDHPGHIPLWIAAAQGDPCICMHRNVKPLIEDEDKPLYLGPKIHGRSAIQRSYCSLDRIFTGFLNFCPLAEARSVWFHLFRQF